MKQITLSNSMQQTARGQLSFNIFKFYVLPLISTFLVSLRFFPDYQAISHPIQFVVLLCQFIAVPTLALLQASRIHRTSRLAFICLFFLGISFVMHMPALISARDPTVWLVFFVLVGIGLLWHVLLDNKDYQDH